MMSSREFLKSVEGKLINNKRKAEPDMRMEVLLGCTSKRIRREIRYENISIENKKEQDTTSIGMFEKSFQKFVDSRPGLENNNQINMFLTETCEGEDAESCLVDDPNQVEMFLRQVESQPQLNSDKEMKLESPIGISTSYSLMEKSFTGSFTDPLLTGSTNIELGILCANFETLYEELLDSLVSVERWMSMAANQRNEEVENCQEPLSQDQHEIMMDLSKVLGI